MNGTVIVEVYTANEALPVAGANVKIYSWRTGREANLITDNDGRTEPVAVGTPSVEATLDRSKCTLPITAVKVSLKYLPPLSQQMNRAAVRAVLYPPAFCGPYIFRNTSSAISGRRRLLPEM